MNSFLKENKNFLTYTLIFLAIISIFGLNFLLSLIGNILLLLVLIPILFLIIFFIGFNSLKTKFKTCNKCGAISIGISENCMNCGAVLNDDDNQNNILIDNPGESTIEINAEEIK